MLRAIEVAWWHLMLEAFETHHGHQMPTVLSHLRGDADEDRRASRSGRGAGEQAMRRLASIAKRIEAAAVRIQPQRWGRMVIDDPDPDARIAEHQAATGGAPCIYRVIVGSGDARGRRGDQDACP